MEQLMEVASYICIRYKNEYGMRIDEMKLHKMLYFAQRESLVQTKEPLFDAIFYGWKFGPVIKEIREAYRYNSFMTSISEAFSYRVKSVMDKIFAEYASKSSWSLSRLTHSEISWKNARVGVADGENGNVPLKLEDIAQDANRIRERRNFLIEIGLA